MAHPFHTIGHANRPLGAFIALLQEAEIGLLADVRTFPRSRRNPQFNQQELSESLAAIGIRYEHFPELGGRRRRQPDVAPDVNAFWENESFHNYADYAMGDGFRAGLVRLRALGSVHRCAIMCAETLWWQCHRRIITDYLLATGETVFHILGPGHVDPARLCEVAERQPAGQLTYPALTGSLFPS